MAQENRLELARWAASVAKNAGADESNVSISNQRDVEIEYRDKKIEKLQESVQNSLYIQIYTGHRYSGQSTNDLRKPSLEKFITEAVKNTQYLASDEYRMLVDPRYFPTNLKTDLKINDPSHSLITTEERLRIVKEIESAALAVSDKIISASSSYNDSHYNTAMVLSNGFEGETEATYYSAGAQVTARDNDARPEDWCYATTRYRADFPTTEYLGRTAAENALRKIGQSKIESGKYPMIVVNRSGGRLINTLTGAMSGRSIQQKASFLDGKIGEKIASEAFTLIDDPLLPKGLGSQLYDDDGIGAQRRVMIENGVLRQFYIGNYYARKLKTEPTTLGSSNLVFAYGNQSFDELVRGLKKGIVVTSFLGGNNNSTTGDFSFGIMGMLVEDGQMTKPLNEMNISGNAKDFWMQLQAMGNDPYPYSGWRIPTMLFDGVNFSGS